jgi:hypothetical protein
LPALSLRNRFQSPVNASVKTALVAVFTALSLGTNYVLTGLPNVKLMDTFDFVASYEFGLSVGIPVVILTRSVYALVNPWGPASGLLIFMLVVGDCFYALSGFLVGRSRLLERGNEVVERSMILGVIGFFSALGFDLFTNFGEGLLAFARGPDLSAYLSKAFIFGLVTMNFPLPLGIVHEVSDFFFFSIVAPAAIVLVARSGVLGNELFKQDPRGGR